MIMIRTRSKPTYLSWIWMDLVFLVAHRFCTFKPLKRFKYSLKITFSFESWKVLVAHVCADAFVCCRSFFDVCLCAGASLIEIHEMLSPFGLLRQCFCLAMLSAKSGGSRFPLASFCKPVVAQRTGIAEARRPLETRQEKEMGRERSVQRMKFQRKRCQAKLWGHHKTLLAQSFANSTPRLAKMCAQRSRTWLNQRLRCVFALRKKITSIASIGRHPPILNFRHWTSAGCSCYSIIFKYIIYS